MENEPYGVETAAGDDLFPDGHWHGHQGGEKMVEVYSGNDDFCRQMLQMARPAWWSPVITRERIIV